LLFPNEVSVFWHREGHLEDLFLHQHQMFGNSFRAPNLEFVLVTIVVVEPINHQLTMTLAKTYAPQLMEFDMRYQLQF